MQPKPEFLNPDDFPEPHMEPVKVSKAEWLAKEIDGDRYGDVAAELRRLAAVEAAYDGKAHELVVLEDAFDRLTDARDQLIEERDDLRADRDRLAAEADALREANSTFASASILPDHLEIVERAEVAALRADAERYRWLRDVARACEVSNIWNKYQVSETDAAIDTAMKEAQ